MITLKKHRSGGEGSWKATAEFRWCFALLCIVGVGTIGLGVWRFMRPVDQRSIAESAEMAGLMDEGQSLTADIARIVRPAIDRTQKLAVSDDVISALKENNAARRTEVCNRAVAMSTEVDAIALFDTTGAIVAINTLYASGAPIDPARVHRALSVSYSDREIVQRCVRNNSDVAALEFQTQCSITPALFDSTGLSIAYSAPVLNPKTGQKIGVISSRQRFDRLLDLIKNRSIGGMKDSIDFVTDKGAYFSEEINSGRSPAPIPTDVLVRMVGPLMNRDGSYSLSQYGDNDVALFRLNGLNTLDNGGLQVMLIASKDWLTKQSRSTILFESMAIGAVGFGVLLFATLFRRNHQLRLSEMALRNREADARELADQLARSEEFARSTVDALRAHIAILDEHGTIVAVNKAWRDSVGAFRPMASPCDLGSNYLRACANAQGSGQADATEMARGIFGVIRGEMSQFSIEYACHAPHEQRWFSGTVTRFAGNGPVHVVVKHEDITTRTLIKEQLNAAKEAAESATRAKSEFLANMSHEIRTPITAIVGFADIMLDPDQTSADRSNGLQTIRRNAQQLLDLISEILDLSKIEAGRMTAEEIATELPPLLSEVMSLMRPRAIKNGIGLNLRFKGTVPRRVRTDPLRAKQILMNLVGNAIKFTEHGHVEICVSSDPDERTLSFEVNDTGIGMSESQMSKIFQPFMQADGSTTRRFGGTGLGLTISKHLAHLLGGDISVVSVAGVGSTFTAKIAWVSDGSSECCQVEDALVTPTLGAETFGEQFRGKILLAEDGKDNQLFISAMLKRAGAEVTIADNGRIAVDKILAGQFDLVLMDMQMPELDGYAATSELRRRGCSIPIIALTAHAMAEDRTKCLKCGCTSYLAKPIDRKLLLETVGRYLQQDRRNTRPSHSITTQPGMKTNRIVSTCATDPEMSDLVISFIENLPSRVESIQSSLAQLHLADLENTVHQLKGAGGSYGFQCLTEAAAIVETSLRKDAPYDTIKSQVDSLVDMIKAIDGYAAVVQPT